MKQTACGLALAFTFLLSIPTVQAQEEDWYDSVQIPGAKWDAKTQTFTFSGPYAAALKQTLPPLHSMMSELDPKLSQNMQKHFRGILLKDPAGNAMAIECDSGKLEYASGSEYRVKESGETICKIIYLDRAKAAAYPSKAVPAADSVKKAQAANQIK